MAKTEAASHLLVVIDHQEAKVYRTEVHGAVPVSLVPYDPHGYKKHLIPPMNGRTASVSPNERASTRPSPRHCEGAEQVLLFGSGTGRSSAMDMLIADLKAHHPDVAEKIVGSVVVDAHHTTENQLLAKARDFYAEFNKK